MIDSSHDLSSREDISAHKTNSSYRADVHFQIKMSL